MGAIIFILIGNILLTGGKKNKSKDELIGSKNQILEIMIGLDVRVKPVYLI